MTSDADRQTLLRIAREAVAAYVNGESSALVEPIGTLAQPAGAFVTLHRHGELRGCIGQVEAVEAVALVVARCAVSAASTDPRFPALTASEFPDITIELSLLRPPELVISIDEIEIGRHGLVVELNRRRGLLLPQVASEWRWERETFVAETCHKAGLPRDAWRHGAKLWKFEAEVFGERYEPRR